MLVNTSEQQAHHHATAKCPRVTASAPPQLSSRPPPPAHLFCSTMTMMMISSSIFTRFLLPTRLFASAILPLSLSPESTTTTTTTSSLTSITKYLWTSLCSACKWASTAATTSQINDSNSSSILGSELHTSPPEYSSDLKYGFLQGTFGLPYGGYIVRPAYGLRTTLTLTDSASMFSVFGTKQEIISYLRSMQTMVFTQMTARTYTSDIVVELYRTTEHNQMTLLRRLLDFSPQRQLVIRAGRSFTPSDFKPLVRIQAPQGLRLCEIAGILEDTTGGGATAAAVAPLGGKNFAVNLTRDKELNIRVMGRLRSASSSVALLGGRDEGSLACFDASSSSDCATLLPPYEICLNGLPPAYSL